MFQEWHGIVRSWAVEQELGNKFVWLTGPQHSGEVIHRSAVGNVEVIPETSTKHTSITRLDMTGSGSIIY